MIASAADEFPDQRSPGATRAGSMLSSASKAWIISSSSRRRGFSPGTAFRKAEAQSAS